MMVALATQLNTETAIDSRPLCEQSLMIIDRDAETRLRWRDALERVGFGMICAVPDVDTASLYVQRDAYDLIFVEVADHAGGNLGLEFVARIKKHGYEGLVVATTREPSADLCYRSARSGVNDFLVKGPHLEIADHAIRLTRPRSRDRDVKWHPETILATGLFTSLGVTHCELRVLEEFARGFPKQQDIAHRLEKDQVYVRKVFSRIYRKMADRMAVTSQAQLSHLLTICSLFNT